MPEQPGSASLSQCPVCNATVPVETLVAHANRCLDIATLPNDIPSPPLSSAPCSPPSSPPSPHASPHKSVPAVPKPAEKPADDILPWLQHHSLHKYAPNLRKAGIHTIQQIAEAAPTDHTLRTSCAISVLGPRRKLLALFQTLPSSSASKAIPKPSPTAKVSGKPSTQPKRKLADFFKPGYQPSVPAAPGPAKRPRFSSSTPAKNLRHASSQRVPGTSFVVDSFNAAKSDPSCTLFFLTHFHADHYKGLRPTTFPKGASILLSAVTARLVRALLRVPETNLRVIPLGVKVDVRDPATPSTGASVWFFDANHCPGAVVVLFHVWRTGRFILHTGDCRFDPDVFNRHTELRRVVENQQLDYLYLDTTYCNPRYTFPKQQSVLESVVQVALEEDRRTRRRCLFFFGTYSIGKEKVFAAVAKALDLNIFTSGRKRAILDMLDLEPDVKRRFVKKPDNARVHIIGMHELAPERLRAYVSKNGLNPGFIGKGLAILFRPTGWSFAGSAAKGPSRTNRPEDQAMLFNVAYSEHSSCNELRAFVQWSKPARLVPTVGAYGTDREKKADEMRNVLGHVDKSLRTVEP